VKVIVALGGFAWRAALDMVRADGVVPSPMPKFGHLASARLGDVTLIGCYHPSQQNTFTGRLTPAMLDDVFTAAKLAISAC
jgi:uracil-DNA glycosylase